MTPLSNQPTAESEPTDLAAQLGPEILPGALQKGTGTLVFAGTLWLLLQTLGSKAVTLGGQLVLAWLLSPEDFGQIGMAYTVTAFAGLLINPGIDVILIQRGLRFQLWSTPAFYFSFCAGLLGGIAILVTAPFAARIYDSTQLTGLLTVLAIATPIGSLMLVPTAKLRSQMRFGALSLINFLQTTLQTLLTLAFAALGYGVYAFVLPMPIVYAAMAALLWYIGRPEISARHPFRHWRYLIGDTSYIFAQRVIQTLVSQGDYILLGVLYGAAIVGPYFLAFGIATQAIRLTAGSLQLVLMAGLSRYTAFSDQQTRAALKATSAIALIGMPLCMIQAVIAGPLLRTIYDQKWEAAIPLVQLISIGMAFDVVSWPVASLLRSRGQFRFLFLWSAWLAPIFLGAISIGGLMAQNLGVAAAVCAYYAAFSPPLAFLVFRQSRVSWKEIGAVFLCPAAVGMLSAGTTIVTMQLVKFAGLPALVQCGLAVCVGILTMAFAARLIMPTSWNEITARLIHAFPALAPLRK